MKDNSPWVYCTILLIALVYQIYDSSGSLTREERGDMIIALKKFQKSYEEYQKTRMELKLLGGELRVLSSEFAYGHSNIFEQNQSFETNIESFRKNVQDFQKKVDSYVKIDEIPIGISKERWEAIRGD
tara:strand:- start:68 stop:451 length:384 start_codon:yes stop_codon:yes gene_type:complete